MADELYSTPDVSKSIALWMHTGSKPTLRPNDDGTVDLVFNRTPELFSAVMLYEQGELLVDAKAYSTRVRSTFRNIRSIRALKPEVER